MSNVGHTCIREYIVTSWASYLGQTCVRIHCHTLGAICPLHRPYVIAAPETTSEVIVDEAATLKNPLNDTKRNGQRKTKTLGQWQYFSSIYNQPAILHTQVHGGDQVGPKRIQLCVRFSQACTVHDRYKTVHVWQLSWEM